MPDSSVPDRSTLPDFILGGAMKSATSSLHRILAQHPSVFIPSTEIHFFCMDDPIQHRNFFFPGHAPQGQAPDYDRDLEENLAWYRDFFAAADPDQWIGEDSTIYLAAPDAPRRIARLLPDVKLIFMLRNPVDRTYSHYWHRVRKGRAVYRFARELEHGPATLLLRGFYKSQLERYYATFPDEQIKVVLFERFVEDTQAVVDEVCSFLELPSAVDTTSMETHHNKSPTPRWLAGQLLANYVLGPESGNAGRRSTSSPPLDSSLGAWLRRKVRATVRRANLTRRARPPMIPALRHRLGQVFARKNRGLGDLFDVDLGKFWPHMTSASSPYRSAPSTECSEDS